jgi:mitochondrial fission protein ELM1
MNKRVSIWRLYDGKTGHDCQSAGLLNALGEFLTLDVRDIDARSIAAAPWLWLRRRFPVGIDCADPDLIIGAGRRCQWPMLAARRARGGRLVYLMRSRLPFASFDLCIVPRHDGLAASDRVWLTDGVLNAVMPSTSHDPMRGVVLIGGPSRHHAWDERSLVQQVRSIIEADPSIDWAIGDSRRTPAPTSDALAGLAAANARFASHRDTPSDWVTATLATAGRVWVTGDSVSMIFEALTAGAAVGVLDVPARRSDRVTRLTDDLLARGLVMDYAGWRAGRDLVPPAVPLWEARRCAEMISERWFAAPPDGTA